MSLLRLLFNKSPCNARIFKLLKATVLKEGEREEYQRTAIDIVSNSTAHFIALVQRGCSGPQLSSKKRHAKEIICHAYVSYSVVICRLDLDLNPLYLIQEHPLLTHAQ